jgi:hypothetical protein
MSDILRSKRACLPDMKKEFQSLQKEWEEAKAARDQRQHLETLKRELAWSYVAEVQNVGFSSPLACPYITI